MLFGWKDEDGVSIQETILGTESFNDLFQRARLRLLDVDALLPGTIDWAHLNSDEALVGCCE